MKKNVFVGVMRSISSVSGEPPEESPLKFRRKLPDRSPKRASQESTCNVRSIVSVSGEPPEESPPKVRRKLPAPLPKKASQASPCNEVPSESEGADTKVIPQPAEPWDKLRGDQFDVIDNESTLDEVVSDSASLHLGPNCGTFTRARERPIPGVRNSPLPLRSNDHPEGLPYLAQPRWKRMRERVERDTYMAKSAARRCINFLKAGLPFTLEHPGNSIARELKEWQELVALDGVFIIEHHHCMFSPCLKRKFQIVITNIPSLADPLSSNSLNRTCSDRKVCSRTNCPHEAFTHEIKDGWVSKFGTAGTAEYPEELCEVQAKGIVEAIVERALFNFKFSFVEVFSGPNAPLTEAVKKYINVLNNSGPGLDLALKRSGPSSSKGPVPLQPPKWSSLESRATGLQPKWNSNFQLIKDGLNDPWEHLARAKSLAHPSMDDAYIHSDTRRISPDGGDS